MTNGNNQYMTNSVNCFAILYSFTKDARLKNTSIFISHPVVQYVGVLAQRMFQNEDSSLGLGSWTPARNSRCIWVVLLMNVLSICSYLVEVNGMQVAAGVTEDEKENQKELIWIYEEFSILNYQLLLIYFQKISI